MKLFKKVIIKESRSLRSCFNKLSYRQDLMSKEVIQSEAGFKANLPQNLIIFFMFLLTINIITVIASAKVTNKTSHVTSK